MNPPDRHITRCGQCGAWAVRFARCPDCGAPATNPYRDTT